MSRLPLGLPDLFLTLPGHFDSLTGEAHPLKGGHFSPFRLYMPAFISPLFSANAVFPSSLESIASPMTCLDPIFAPGRQDKFSWPFHLVPFLLKVPPRPFSPLLLLPAHRARRRRLYPAGTSYCSPLSNRFQEFLLFPLTGSLLSMDKRPPGDLTGRPESLDPPPTSASLLFGDSPLLCAFPRGRVRVPLLVTIPFYDLDKLVSGESTTALYSLSSSKFHYTEEGRF